MSDKALTSAQVEAELTDEERAWLIANFNPINIAGEKSLPHRIAESLARCRIEKRAAEEHNRALREKGEKK